MATKTNERRVRRDRRHRRVRKKVVGTTERPRLAVYRSLNNIEAQVIDDTRGVTLLG
jgi:large subunit ribosomal protein L18